MAHGAKKAKTAGKFITGSFYFKVKG